MAEATTRHEGCYTAKKPRLHSLADLENLSAHVLASVQFWIPFLAECACPSCFELHVASDSTTMTIPGVKLRGPPVPDDLSSAQLYWT